MAFGISLILVGFARVMRISDKGYLISDEKKINIFDWKCWECRKKYEY